MRKFLLCLLAIAPVSCAPSPAYPAPLNEDQAAIVYTLVYGVTHLPLPDKSPEVHLTTNLELQKMACPHGCATIKGFQLDDKIYFDRNLDFADPYVAAIMFHEFVHYYQWNKALHERCGADQACLDAKVAGRAKSCREWVDREIYAYQMQNLVLHRAGLQLVQPPSMPNCPEPEPVVQPRRVYPEHEAGYGNYTENERKMQ